MNKLILVVILFILVGVVSYFSLLSGSSQTSQITAAKEIAKVQESIPAAQTQNGDYYYPLPGYDSRIKEREYGQYFTGSEKVNAPCGKPFVGYHTGDDLETISAEKNTEVPVVAIAKGQILQVGFVSGYGGLIVQESKINNERVTIYYGHMDLKSIPLKSGDVVEAGQFIGNLGDECSTETDDARKHLHFAIKKGGAVDVRGYVPSKEILSNWVNPEELLNSLNASIPNQG